MIRPGAATAEELTYCLNIHPAETLDEVIAALSGPVAAVRSRVAPGAPFPIGLRVSARALADLDAPGARARLEAVIDETGLRPITMNGFPYGPFHGRTVKKDVYLPDWRSDERLVYTNGLTDLMAGLAGAGAWVSLSTVPGCFRPNAEGSERGMAARLIAAAVHAVETERRTGATVALAIEPEPCCFLETIAETIDFFENRLYGRAARVQMAEMAGVDPSRSEQLLRRHLGLCYDVCHAAVEYEDPGGSLDALERAGLPVNKLQLSAALRISRVDAAAREALRAYHEPTYLHQVVSRGAGGDLRRFADLPEALARGAAADGEEWRVHYHVPIFLRDLGAFESTQDFLTEILERHRERPISPHLEVETYTWTVLPDDLRQETIDGSIERELSWVKERLA